MATSKQEQFFDELLAGRRFPEGSPPAETMRETFKGLSQNAASEWIDKALKLPKIDADEGGNVPPPF